MFYRGPKIGPVLQAAALRRRDRNRKNFLRGRSPTRAHWIIDLGALAAIAFAFIVTFIKVFGL